MKAIREIVRDEMEDYERVTRKAHEQSIRQVVHEELKFSEATQHRKNVERNLHEFIKEEYEKMKEPEKEKRSLSEIIQTTIENIAKENGVKLWKTGPVRLLEAVTPNSPFTEDEEARIVYIIQYFMDWRAAWLEVAQDDPAYKNAPAEMVRRMKQSRIERQEARSAR
jgi:hypothetical protein